MAVPLFKVSSDPTIIKLVQDGNDTMIDELGKLCKIVCEGDKTPCPNCVFDSTTNRSSGTYLAGGPKPFSKGKCPVCKGSGYNPSDSERVVIKQFKIRRNVKPQEIEAGGTLTSPITVARIKGYLKDLPDLNGMKYIILDYKNEKYINERYIKLTEPSPTGNLVPGRYFIMYLKKATQ